MTNRLKEIRKSKNITQAELAKAVGVTREYISIIENGKGNATINVLSAIAKKLDIKITDIFLD